MRNSASLRLLGVALLALIADVAGLHESEVGVVDWHKSLVGFPLIGHVATAPAFYPDVDGSGDALMTATEGNVLAAVDAKNGSIAWRYMFESDDPIALFARQGDVVASLSGPGGSTLRLFTSRGALRVERRLHAPTDGRLVEPHGLGTAIALAEEGDALVLTNGCTLRRIDGKTGQDKWIWNSEDQGSLVTYIKLVASPSTGTAYLIGLAASFASPTLHLAAISLTDGTLTSSAHVSSKIASPSSVLALRNAALWLEAGTVRFVPLKPELSAKGVYYIKGKDATYREVVDVGLGDNYGVFVGVKDDGTARVLRSSGEGDTVETPYEFPESASSEMHSESTFAGAVSGNGKVKVSRVYWSNVLKRAAVQTITLSDGSITTWAFPFSTRSHGIIQHATSHPDTGAVCVTTTTGSLQLWSSAAGETAPLWTREEALSDVRAAAFVPLPPPASEVASGDASFSERVLRQIADARHFPEYAQHFVRRFVTGAHDIASAATGNDAETELVRDAFGFRQVLVLATPRALFGVDTLGGRVLWKRVWGLGWAAEIGGEVLPVKAYVRGGTQEVVVVTQRRASNTLVDTVVFLVEALTGTEIMAGRQIPDADVLAGVDLISGPSVDATQLPNNGPALVLDEFLQAYTFPPAGDDDALVGIHVPLRAGSRLVGHVLAKNAALSVRPVAQPTWSAALPPGEDVVSIVRPAGRAPVASLGRVMGNRTTRYKYLSPHLSVVLTASNAHAHVEGEEGRTCGVYVLENVKGTVVYSAVVPAHAGVCDVKAMIVENWVVYGYYDGVCTAEGDTKGWKVVSVELYEGGAVDQKFRSSDISSYSNKTLDVSAYERTYLFPYRITAIATTSTQFGVSTKDIIVATQNHKIQSIPRRFLDPRRTTGKPTSQDMEEFLIQYDPVLPADPRRTLSHSYDVANIRAILTAPALLESTSLVFAYGQDLFLTRVAPSGTFDVLSESFNKAQLVLTIAGLAAAITVTKPMVRRKRLKEKWYL